MSLGFSEYGPMDNRVFGPLRFSDPHLEREFRNHYWTRAIPHAQFAMGSAALLGLAFGFLDLLVAKYALGDLWAIRFGILMPAIVLGFAYAFVDSVKDRYHLVVMVVAIVVGGSIITMVAVLDPPESDYYYAGLIMVLFFSYTFLQLRVPHAALVAVILTGAYEIVAVFVQSSPPKVIANNTFFLLAANYGGIFACYSIERTRRNNFLSFRENAKRQQELARMTLKLAVLSSRDDLTNLLNRRQLPALFSRCVNQYRLYGRPTAALLIDLDNFKKVNDSFGHDVGDQVLRKTSSIILKAIGPGDLAFRYGGDEFLVLLPEKAETDATAVANKIVRIFDGWSSTNFLSKTHIGVSIGAAELTSKTRFVEQLIHIADSALYAAKRGGKGRVVRASQIESRNDHPGKITSAKNENDSGDLPKTERPQNPPRPPQENPESKNRNPLIWYFTRFRWWLKTMKFLKPDPTKRLH